MQESVLSYFLPLLLLCLIHSLLAAAWSSPAHMRSCVYCNPLHVKVLGTSALTSMSEGASAPEVLPSSWHLPPACHYDREAATSQAYANHSNDSHRSEALQAQCVHAVAAGTLRAPPCAGSPRLSFACR